MKVGGDYTFDGPQDLVLRRPSIDPVVLAGVIPDETQMVGETWCRVHSDQDWSVPGVNSWGKSSSRDIKAPTHYVQVDGQELRIRQTTGT